MPMPRSSPPLAHTRSRTHSKKQAWNCSAPGLAVQTLCQRCQKVSCEGIPLGKAKNSSKNFRFSLPYIFISSPTCDKLYSLNDGRHIAYKGECEMDTNTGAAP